MPLALLLTLLALVGCASICARLIGAPRAVSRLLLGVALALLLATPFATGADPARLASGLGWAALIAAPVVLYALLLRRLRRGIRAAAAAPAAPLGLVRIDPDTALTAETRAALDASADTLSLAWREGPGRPAGHLRLRRRGDTAEIELLFVDPAHRGRGIAARLLAAAETEARDRAPTRLACAAEAPPEPTLFLDAGFTIVTDRDLGRGARRAWLEKELA